MKFLEVFRKQYFNDTTIGDLFIDKKFFCYTLEDKVRINEPKIEGKTAIPAGIYKIAINFSNHFKRDMIEILSVPNFEGVRIHGGNTHRDTEGCILVAKNIVGDKTIQGTMEKPLFEYVKKQIGLGEDIAITIYDDLIQCKSSYGHK